MLFNIDYDTAKINQIDRLKKAEKQRLVELAKSAQQSEAKKRRFVLFRFGRTETQQFVVVSSNC